IPVQQTGHALLWSGTPDSFVDLNPTGFTASDALATNGFDQVGYGIAHGWYALLWTGSASSAINLGLLLPPALANSEYSQATSIDSAGNVYGWAYSNEGPPYSQFYVVEWSPVPEPS